MPDRAHIDDQKHRIKTKIWIESDMFYSEAFQSLSASALRTLLRFLQKRVWVDQKRHGTKSHRVYIDGDIIFPYGEAASLGIKTTQFWINIGILIEKGFIDIAYQGGRYQKDQHNKDYSRYRLSKRWEKYRLDPVLRDKAGFVPGKQRERILKEEHTIKAHLNKAKTKPTSGKRSCQLQESEVDMPKEPKTPFHIHEDSKTAPATRKRRVNVAK